MKSRRASTAANGKRAAASPPNGGVFLLETFLPYRLAVASARISREFAAIYRERFAISAPEWRILAHLSQAGAVSVRDIHARVDMDKPKVSRAAASLERKGYVEKLAHAGDRRLVSLSLTKAGRKLMAQIAPVALAFQKRLRRRLGDDAAAFGATLGRMIEPQ